MAVYYVTTSFSNLDITEANSFAVITGTGSVQNLLTLTSSGNSVSISGYVGTVTTTLSGPSVDNIISISSSGVTNSILVAGAGNKINNAGSIIAVDDGNVAFGYSGIELYDFGSATTADPKNYITNSGAIFTSNPDYYVPPSSPGVGGYIEMSYAVVIRNSNDTIFSNSGTISATYGHAIKLGSGSDTFRNSGTIFGNVELGDGNNATYNTGSIYGDVFLGNGNNTFRSQTGEVFGIITAGNGNNSIFAASNGGQIVTGSGADVIRGSESDDVFTAGDGADRLRGMGGDDALNGGVGIDVMIGGGGDDTYYTDDPNDVLNEAKDYGEGEDTVHVLYAADFNLGTQSQLAGEFEHLVLTGVTGLENLNGTGTTASNTIWGNGGANQLSGLGGNDLLYGGGGADTLLGGTGSDMLDGEGGNDSMAGGAGSDVYRVDSPNDVTDETGGAGTDTIILGPSFFTYSLSDAAHVKGQVENLQFLTYVGTTFSIGTGNALNNVITGNDGRNKFIGLDGNDTLIGSGGDDILAGGVGADRLLGGTGSDTADYSGSAQNIILALDGSLANLGEAAGDTFSSIEVFLGTNSATGDTMFGDTAANSLQGNGGNDIINGRAGDDVLTGGAGSDTLTGDIGSDRFTYRALDDGGDTITDFSPVNDFFFFSRTVFTGDGTAWPSGFLSAGLFVTRASDHAAQDGNDFFIFQSDTSQLWYDPTGNDIAGDEILIATLQAGATMTSSDILLFS